MLRAFALLACSLLCVPAQANEELAARTCLQAQIWESYADGWGIRTMTTAQLGQGAHRSYLVTLYRGNEYAVRSCGDAGIKDLELYLYDLNGQVVARSGAGERAPSLTFKPEQTGTFYIVVHARELNDPEAQAGVAVAVTYR